MRSFGLQPQDDTKRKRVNNYLICHSAVGEESHFLLNFPPDVYPKLEV
jgi:hypothetical protein